MGIIDSLESAGGAIGKYFSDRFGSVADAYSSAWTNDVPTSWKKLWGGVFTMAMSPGKDRDSFAKGLGLWLDGTIGLGGGLLKGTIGGAFEAPVLHEATWLLDKTYRYTMAYPTSWAFTTIGAQSMAVDAARKRGTDPLSAWMGAFWDRQPFGDKGIWSQDARAVTPGQGAIWALGGFLSQTNPGNSNDPVSWLRSHDPRTPEGQAKFNSEDADFLLKYGSGTIDFFGTVAGDPTVAFAAVAKAARLRYKGVVTPAKAMDSKFLEKEVNSSHFEAVYQAARQAAESGDPEKFRQRVMPNAPFGPQASVALVAAAKAGREVFRDAYVVARGMDGLYMPRPSFKLRERDYARGETPVEDIAFAGQSGVTKGGAIMPDGSRQRAVWTSAGERKVERDTSPLEWQRPDVMGAQERLLDLDPDILIEFHRAYNAWNIGEDALKLGFDAEPSAAIMSLVRNEARAFASKIFTEQLPGRLMNTERPRVTRLNDLRLGVHTFADKTAPIIVGKMIRSVMPSQGYAPFIDTLDRSAMSLTHFKALLTRSGMDPHHVERWVSKWAATAFPEARHAIWEQAKDEAIAIVAERHGLDFETVKAALPEVARYQSAAKALLEQGETYMSERAARGAAVAAYRGLQRERAELKKPTERITAADRKGQFGETAVVLPDADGHTTIMLQDSRVMPSLAPDPSRAVLLTQTRRYIPTIDFQSLDAQLKWWKWQHRPTKMRAAGDVTAGEAVKHVGSWTLSQIARTKAVWDGLITSADFANMIWKASALLRPAQTPRNLADDVLRRMFVFGKLPLLMGTMKSVPRIVQNFGGKNGRAVLLHDYVNEQIVRRKASRTSTVDVKADVIDHAPHNNDLATKVRAATELLHKPDKYKSAEQVFPDVPNDLGQAWIDGLLDWETIFEALEAWHGAPYMWGHMGLAYNVMEDWRRGLLGIDEKLSTTHPTVPRPEATPRQPSARYQVALEEWEKKAEQARKEGRPVPKKPVDPDAGRLEAPDLSTIRSWVTDAGKNKQVPLAQLEREIKVALLRRYFGRANRDLAFLRDAPSRSVTNLEADLPGAPTGRQRSYLAAWISQAWAEHQKNALKKGVVDPAPGHIFVNPFDGGYPPGLTPDDMELLPHTNLDRPINKDGSVNENAIKWLENFIVDNLDDLLRPDHLLSMAVDLGGNIRMSVARARSGVATRMAIKPSANFRLKNFKLVDIIDAGHKRIRVELPDGKTLELEAAFEGELGEEFLHRASAAAGNGTWQYLVGDFSPLRMLDQEGGYGIVRPGERGYAPSWERAVNVQLASDEVAKQFLAGRTPTDVIHWAERTREGKRWIRRIKYLGTDYVERIHHIFHMVNDYVPFVDSPEGYRLREAVLQRKATYDDLKAVKPATKDQPEVHGASLRYNLGRGAVFTQISRAVDMAQKILSDIPTDKASRFPFFAEAYRRHLTDLVRVASSHGRRHAERDPAVLEALRQEQGTVYFDPDTKIIPQETLRNLEMQARERALYDTKYYLYDVTMMNDVARLTRLIVPFSSAIMDSYIKYSRIARDTGGGAILQGMYYWEMFDRNEAIQDENGFVLRKGPNGDEWYSKDPETGEMVRVSEDKVGKERYVQFRLPSELGHMVGKKYFGVEMQPVFAVNKRNFNVFLDLPSSGPLVALPANEFALDNPEFGESATIKRFVLPYGPSTDRAKVAIPSTVRSAWEAFQGADGTKAEAQAKSIFQAELISYARGERKTLPTFAEARERSAMMKGLRFSASWITPVSFQVTSPYQPYIDTYRQLVREDPQGADEKFLARYGDEFYAVAMSVTRNNAGLSATLESQKAFEKHRTLVETYPELGGLITGGEGGTFSKSVYEAQKQTPVRPGSDQMIRETMSLDESVQQLEKRRVWDLYSKMMDTIDAEMVDRKIRSLRDKRAKDLVQMRDSFIEANKYWKDPATGATVPSPWFEDYSTTDSAKMNSRIEAMWKIVQDPDLQKRDDIRGLVDYLDARERMQEKMQRLKVKTLDAAKASKLKVEWEQTVNDLRTSNVAFAPLWSRYLSNDDKLDY